MRQEEYVKSIIKYLKSSNKKKSEIEKQLNSDIQIAFESGESLEEIFQRMGAPSEIAQEFNENFTEADRVDMKKAKAFKVAGIVIGVLVIVSLFIYWYIPKTGAVDDTSVFDKNAVQTQAEAVIDLINAGDYETLQSEYANEVMKPFLTKEKIQEAKGSISGDWGAFDKTGKVYMTELTQKGEKYVVVQINASYTNVSVTYTITFDEQLKLAGLYIK